MDVDIYQLGSGTKRLLAQTGLVGSVHSLFESTINISIADHILSLQHSSLVKTPFMLSLPPGCYLKDLALTSASRVRVEGAGILVGNHRLRLANASHWEGRLPVFFSKQKQIESLRRGVSRALGMAAKMGRGNSIDYHLGQVMYSVHRLLKTAPIEGREGEVISALTSLIGLGPGLTPYGDDFLVAFLSVLSLMGKANPALEKFAACLRRMIGNNGSQTTPVSREFLYYACRGEYSEPFHRLYGEALSLDGQRTLTAALRFTGIGHTSGVASLTGVLCGLDFCAVN